LRGPGLHTFDISGIKDLNFGNRYRLQFAAISLTGFHTPHHPRGIRSARRSRRDQLERGLLRTARFSCAEAVFLSPI